MKTRSALATWLRGPGILLLLISLAQFALHLWTNARDNIFRDEMYYLVAAQHPAFSYLEFPPFVALVAGVSQGHAGRLGPGHTPAPSDRGGNRHFADRQHGGHPGRWDRGAGAGRRWPRRSRRFFLASSGLLTMDPFDQLWWTLLAWVMMRMIRDQRPQRWLLGRGCDRHRSADQADDRVLRAGAAGRPAADRDSASCCSTNGWCSGD